MMNPPGLHVCWRLLDCGIMSRTCEDFIFWGDCICEATSLYNAKPLESNQWNKSLIFFSLQTPIFEKYHVSYCKTRLIQMDVYSLLAPTYCVVKPDCAEFPWNQSLFFKNHIYLKRFYVPIFNHMSWNPLKGPSLWLFCFFPFFPSSSEEN